MKQFNLSTKNKSILLVALGVVILVLVFLFVYQKNMDKVASVEAQSETLENQVKYLQSLQTQVAELEQDSQEKETEMSNYLDKFAPKITLEKSIYYIYMMSVDTEVTVSAIEPGNSATFFEKGNVVEKTEDTANTENTEEQKTSTVKEENEEALNEKKTIDQMTGKMATYKITLSGEYDKVMAALDWVRDHDENMSLGATSFAYDSGTGELAGTMDINFYSMQGNGATYEEPDLTGFKFGEDNVFGTFLKDNDSDED